MNYDRRILRESLAGFSSVIHPQSALVSVIVICDVIKWSCHLTNRGLWSHVSHALAPPTPKDLDKFGTNRILQRPPRNFESSCRMWEQARKYISKRSVKRDCRETPRLGISMVNTSPGSTTGNRIKLRPLPPAVGCKEIRCSSVRQYGIVCGRVEKYRSSLSQF